jgi:predicted HicB family RNase H-like nuclease
MMIKKKEGIKMATKAHLEGNKRYLDKLDDIKVRVPKGRREILQSHAAAVGESLNSFINRAIDEAMERDRAAQDNGN